MGKYDGWNGFFRDADGDDIVLDFAQLEELIGDVLPPSARRHAAWWSGAQYFAVWTRHGWRATPDLRRGTVRFRRLNPKAVRQTTPEPPSALANERLVLLGCVKTKLDQAAPAKDLYISALWQKRRAYAEASGQPWRILSAEHGLLDPDEVIAPYDRHLKSQSPAYQREWSDKVARSILVELDKLGLRSVEIHASSAYVMGIRPILTAAGIMVDWPFEGLTQGEHLSWYGHNSGLTAPAPTAVAELSSGELVDWPRLTRAEQIEPFEFRWPDTVESFDQAWEGVFQYNGRTWRFRHGVAGRVVYGRRRVHTVTWLNGAPTVEGVGADDYERSLGIDGQATRRSSRSLSAVPCGRPSERN
jgi:hypothetical protein